MTTKVLDLQTLAQKGKSMQAIIDKAMRETLDSIFDCYWDGEYEEEFLASIQKYRKKDAVEWAKLLYNSQLKEEGGLKFECGPVFGFVEDVAKAALKQVNWTEMTQHTEKLLQRKV